MGKGRIFRYGGRKKANGSKILCIYNIYIIIKLIIKTLNISSHPFLSLTLKVLKNKK